MSLRFHRFLPTYGDSRYLVGEGVLPELRRRALWSHPDGGPVAVTPAGVPFAGAAR